MARLQQLTGKVKDAFMSRSLWLRWFLPVFFLVGVLNLAVGNWVTASLVFIMVALNWVSSRPDAGVGVDWSWSGWLAGVGFPCLVVLMMAVIISGTPSDGSVFSTFRSTIAAFFAGIAGGLLIMLTRSHVKFYKVRVSRALGAAIYDQVQVKYPDESTLQSSAEFDVAYDAAWDAVKVEREALLTKWMAVDSRFIIFGMKPSRKVLLVESGVAPERALDADVQALTMEDLEVLVALRKYAKGEDENADLF